MMTRVTVMLSASKGFGLKALHTVVSVNLNNPLRREPPSCSASPNQQQQRNPPKSYSNEGYQQAKKWVWPIRSVKPPRETCMSFVMLTRKLLPLQVAAPCVNCDSNLTTWTNPFHLHGKCKLLWATDSVQKRVKRVCQKDVKNMQTLWLWPLMKLSIWERRRLVTEGKHVSI